MVSSLVARLQNLGFAGPDAYLKVAFSRNLGLISDDEQKTLRAARVAIPGLGGVGGIHLLTLVRTGIGRFHVADMDSFEPANVNRQAGARVPTFERSKVDVMVEDALAINPHLDLKTFPQGISPANVDAFLEGVQVVVDSLDFYEFDIRRLLITRALEKGIHVVIAGPLGFSVTLLVFSPTEGMTFDEYFDVKEGMSAVDKTVTFLLGLAPRTGYWKYVDSSRLNPRARSAPSLGLACHLCSGVAATEVVRILLKRGHVKAAPHYFQFDPYLQVYHRGYLVFGNRHPLQRLKRMFAKAILGGGGETTPAGASAASGAAPGAADFQERVDKAYSSPPWWYNVRGFLILRFAYRSTLLQQVKFFERNLSARHLEVAVGTGTLLKFVLFLGRLRRRPRPEVAAFDYAATMAAGAERAFKGWKNVEVKQGDATRMSFADGSFESVNIANAFHCFYDPSSALAETWRVLAPGGTVAANVLLYPRGHWLSRGIAAAIIGWGVRKGLLVSPFDAAAVRDMFIAHGFLIREETTSGNTLNILAAKPGR